jgi:hypothetical protein
MMPFLKSSGNFQIQPSFGNLNNFFHKNLIIAQIFSDCFEASPHQLELPFPGQFFGPISHVKRKLYSFKHFPQSFSLM